MGTKELVLRELEQADGAFRSGAAIARELGVSRNAVWKAVAALRREGYRVDAVTNRGYRLEEGDDLLSASRIASFLPADTPLSVTVRRTVDSTNAEVLRRAVEGAPEGTVVAAEEQTAGRGRRGRPFFSPAGTGIYLSILVRPGLSADRAHYLTCAAAVACAEAIEACTGVEASVKWVNDVYCRGRKVTGVLTEGSFDVEGGELAYAVVGVGMNVRPPREGFPEEIARSAGAVLSGKERASAVRCRLVAEVCGRFWELYRARDAAGADARLRERYRSRCFLLGQHVVATVDGRRLRALAVDVDERFRLVIELPDGTRRALSYGEATMAGLQDNEAAIAGPRYSEAASAGARDN